MVQEEKIKLLGFISEALREDMGDGDHTSLATIPASQRGEAVLIMKANGILAGVEEALAVFEVVDREVDIQLFKQDGDAVVAGDVVFSARGSIHSILLAERLLLNIMQRMSGIATVTHQIMQNLSGTNTRVLDTRKTTPLLRFLEKKAVAIGGGTNHRFGLYDMILIKDNHVDYAGGIRQAIEKANAYRKELGRPIAIEVEVRNLDELQQVLNTGHVDRIMFDNFTPSLVEKAVSLVNGQYVTEASGGITAGDVREYALAGVDYISIGALTHSVMSLDMSLKAKALDE